MQKVYKKGPWFVWKGEVLDLILIVTQSANPSCFRCAPTMCTRQLGQHSTSYSVFRPPSEHPFTVFRYGGASPFLASWLDRRSANGLEGAPLFTSFQVLTDGAKRRCPSSWGQATRKDDPGQPAGTTSMENKKRRSMMFLLDGCLLLGFLSLSILQMMS